LVEDVARSTGPVASGRRAVRRRVTDPNDVLVSGAAAGGAPPVIGVQQSAVIDAIEQQLLVRNVDEPGKFAGHLGDGGVSTRVDGKGVAT
jgi:hypothetical protein